MKASLTGPLTLVGVVNNVTCACQEHTNVEDAAETATPQLRKFVNPEHLDIGPWTSLAGEPLLKLDHLHVLKFNAGVNAALDDRLRDVHSTSNGFAVSGLHAIVLCQLINLDLSLELALLHVQYLIALLPVRVSSFPYLSKFANVTNLLALQATEVRGDPAIIEIHHTGEWLI
jgi:hypothetical protein